jgi:hypothetical protein
MAAEYKTGTVLIQNGGNGRGSWLGLSHFVLFETPSRPGAREITSSAISVGATGRGSAPLLLRTRIIKKESE